MTYALRPRITDPDPTANNDAVGNALVIVGQSAAMLHAVALARRLARGNLPVLLVGETGTGKEVLANAIHVWSSRKGRLVGVDCGTLSDGTIVSELMGHRRGAYTGAVDSSPGLIEQADNGTLFLDEIGSLSSKGQAPLLRVLETKRVRGVGRTEDRGIDFRLIATAQSDFASLVASGKLRQDLMHRLAGAVIHLPPLRDRPEDIPLLAAHFARADGRVLSAAAAILLSDCEWRGNVRELRFAVERAVQISEDAVLSAEAVAAALKLGSTLLRLGEESSELLARQELRALCALHRGHSESIAAALGVSRATLFRRLAATGISLRGLQTEGAHSRSTQLKPDSQSSGLSRTASVV